MAFIGRKLPEFSLDAYDPSKEEFVTDKDLLDKCTVLIF